MCTCSPADTLRAHQFTSKSFVHFYWLEHGLREPTHVTEASPEEIFPRQLVKALEPKVPEQVTREPVWRQPEP